jgi:hypothetical protein
MARALYVAAVAMTTVLAVGCTAGTGTSGSSTAAPPPVEFGQTARDGKFEFTATKMFRGPTLAKLGLSDFRHTPDGEYVVVVLRVHNISEDTKLYSAGAQKLSAGGRQYDDDAMAEVALPDNHPTLDVAKGKTLETTVIFDVPVGVTIDALQVHDSLQSTGASIKLAGAPVDPLSAQSTATPPLAQRAVADRSGYASGTSLPRESRIA